MLITTQAQLLRKKKTFIKWLRPTALSPTLREARIMGEIDKAKFCGGCFWTTGPHRINKDGEPDAFAGVESDGSLSLIYSAECGEVTRSAIYPLGFADFYPEVVERLANCPLRRRRRHKPIIVKALLTVDKQEPR